MAAPRRATRPDDPVAIGERLRLIRLAYGVLQGQPKISQSAFARLCDIGIPAWNNVETGSYRIGIDNAISVVRRTGVSLDYIYLGERAGLPHALAVVIARLEEPPLLPAKRAETRA